jgi:uncharacterized protein (TIGR02145 family)/uncharacterized repeat protein (TIGR02543 family)
VSLNLNLAGGALDATSHVPAASVETGEGGKLEDFDEWEKPTRSGYIFRGWFKSSSGGEEVTANTVFGAATIIFAKWGLIPITITFSPNGGTLPANTPTTAETNDYGKLEKLPVPTRENYKFDGWFLYRTYISSFPADNNRVRTLDDVYIPAPTGWNFPELFARWTWNATPYTITFDANGGTAVSPSSATTVEGFFLESLPPETTREGYLFVAWFTEKEGGVPVRSGYGGTLFEKNTTIYARWAEPWNHEKFEDGRDGKFYGWVKIGEKVWMAENLDYAGDGPGGTPVGACHTNNPKNCEIYGRLYTHNDALEACPAGWSLPTIGDWGALLGATGVTTTTGGEKLRSKGYWPAGALGTDEVGFSILPAGARDKGDRWQGLGSQAWFWTTTLADVRVVSTGGGVGGATSSARPTMASVRCVKDD